MKGHQWRLIVDSLLLGVVGVLSTQAFPALLQLSQYLFLTW